MVPPRNRFAQSLIAGLAGAATVTLIHEVTRRTTRRAPRMDVVARESIGRMYEMAGAQRPFPNQLQKMAFTGDLLSNTAYYALTGWNAWGWHPMTRGAAMGAAAGLGAVFLPPMMGLPAWPTQRSRATQAMAFGWYFLGGLAAGAVMTAFESAPMYPRSWAERQTGRAEPHRHTDWGGPAVESQRRVERTYPTPT